MKTKFSKLLLIAAGAFALAGCGKDDPGDTPDKTSEGFGIKSAAITYKITYVSPQSGDVTGMKFIFDDYGKCFRIETWIDESSGTVIVDETANIHYVLSAAEMSYASIPYSDASAAQRLLFTYLYNDPGASGVAGITRLPERTIAGKTCSAVSAGGTAVFAGWKRITFYLQSPESTMEATSFSETIPSGSFTIPEGYVKL